MSEGLPKHEQAAKLRWNIVQMMVTEANVTWPLMGTLMIMAIARRTVPNKNLVGMFSRMVHLQGDDQIAFAKSGEFFYFLIEL